MKQKKIPLRMCVGCREMKEKRSLLRVHKPPEGEVKIDTTGKAPGRGAYVCKNVDCAKKAKKTRALQRALETDIGDAVFDQLLSFIEEEQLREKNP